MHISDLRAAITSRIVLRHTWCAFAAQPVACAACIVALPNVSYCMLLTAYALVRALLKSGLIKHATATTTFVQLIYVVQVEG